MVVVAPDRLDDVVGEVRPRRDEHIDMSPPYEVGDDASHAAGDHRAREAEELQCFVVAQHPLVDVDRLPERPPVVGTGFPEFVDEFADRHPGADLRLLNRFPVFEGHDTVTPILYEILASTQNNGSSLPGPPAEEVLLKNAGPTIGSRCQTGDDWLLFDTG